MARDPSKACHAVIHGLDLAVVLTVFYRDRISLLCLQFSDNPAEKAERVDFIRSGHLSVVCKSLIDHIAVFVFRFSDTGDSSHVKIALDHALSVGILYRKIF